MIERKWPNDATYVAWTWIHRDPERSMHWLKTAREWHLAADLRPDLFPADLGTRAQRAHYALKYDLIDVMAMPALKAAKHDRNLATAAFAIDWDEIADRILCQLPGYESIG